MTNVITQIIEPAHKQELSQQIKAALSTIASTKAEIKKKKGEMTEILYKDSDFVECEENIEALRKHRDQRRRELIKSNEKLSALTSELKDLRGISKSYQLSLSDCLGQYQEKTQARQFNGKQIIKNYSLEE